MIDGPGSTQSFPALQTTSLSQTSLKEPSVDSISSIECKRSELHFRPSRIPVLKTELSYRPLPHLACCDSPTIRAWKLVKPGLKKHLTDHTALHLVAKALLRNSRSSEDKTDATAKQDDDPEAAQSELWPVTCSVSQSTET
ncbi:cytosolic carboxypeptidase-like protein 5 isoform X1 [Tachysurus ichikawai]